MTKMGRTVCIDTHIFLWGLKRNRYAPNPPELLERCDLLFKKLDKEKCRLFVPTVVMGEAMVLLNETERISLLYSLAEKELRLASFDLKAAQHFAIIQSRNLDIVKKMKEDKNYTAKHIKADIMIIASALSVDADLIYSNDAGLIKLARGFIDVYEVPPLNELNEPQQSFEFHGVEV